MRGGGPGGTGFQIEHVSGGFFSEISVGGGGQKRRGEGDSMFSSGSSVGELFEAGQFF